MISCKEDLNGVVIRINSKTDADAVIDCCKKYGVPLANWENTKYKDGRVAAKIGYESGDMGGKLIFASRFLPSQSSASEFIGLRELKLSDITSKNTKLIYIEQKTSDAVFLFDKYQGLLYSAPDKSQKYADLQDYISNLDECGFSNLYLLVETLVDERQEFIDGANEILARNEGIHFSELLGKMYDSGKYKMVSEDE